MAKHTIYFQVHTHATSPV